MLKKTKISLAFFPIFITTGCAKESGPKNEIVSVDYVNDGDTFKADGKSYRLFGVDTPETSTGSPSFNPTIGIEAFYAALASNFTKQQIFKKQVEVTPIEIDKYDRIVAKVNYPSDLGLQLISNGLARVAYISVDQGNPFYSTDYVYYQELLIAQYKAYQRKIGIWENPDLFKTIFPKAS